MTNNISQPRASQPIGIFDSGIGGLTVMRAVVEQLPHEDIVYFGDTAHLPYGDKSAATIQNYCSHIVDFLVQKNCKLILVACNSAAAAAYEFLTNYLQQQTILISVIEPMIEYVAQNFTNQTLGLIGTRQTIAAEIFLKKISTLPQQLNLKSLATPLLVPIIEENLHHDAAIIQPVLNHYLNHKNLAEIDALILGCTHYPLIKAHIEQYHQKKIPLLDAGQITAVAVKKLLNHHQLLNQQTTLGQQQFYLSDLTTAFVQTAAAFFGETIQIKTSIEELC